MRFETFFRTFEFEFINETSQYRSIYLLEVEKLRLLNYQYLPITFDGTRVNANTSGFKYALSRAFSYVTIPWLSVSSCYTAAQEPVFMQ